MKIPSVESIMDVLRDLSTDTFGDHMHVVIIYGKNGVEPFEFRSFDVVGPFEHDDNFDTSKFANILEQFYNGPYVIQLLRGTPSGVVINPTVRDWAADLQQRSTR